MAKKHKPRSGSMAYYPRKRARKINPNFKTIKNESEEVSIATFTGFKVGMAHVTGINTHKEATTFNQKISVPVTIIETPPLKIIGYKAYKKENSSLKAVFEVKQEKNKKTKKKERKNPKIKASQLCEVRLIAKTQPKLAGTPKKKERETELYLTGTPEKQLNFAKEMIGKQVQIEEVFKTMNYLDVKGVTKGKGIQGVVKRFGVKMLRPHDKKQRVVGSIGPWNPSTVMFTVARPGQTGFHTRTEYNKKIIKIGKAEELKKSFKKYGKLKNSYLMLKGSIMGPPKREIVLRQSIRNKPAERETIEEVEKIVL